MKFNKKHIRRTARLIIIYPFLRLLIFLFRVLPISWVRRFATFVAGRVYHSAHSSRKRTLSNLTDVYGDQYSSEELETMARSVYVEMVQSFFDYIAYSNLVDKDKYFSLIEVVGQEHLQAAYDKGKGVICLIPHLSSWEFAAITPPMLGYETSAASAAMKMKILQKRMVRFRERRGMKNITRDGSYAKLVEVLKKGECLIIMIDQDTKVKSAFVHFMGKLAYTPIGASRLAFDTGAAVVPMAMTRKEDGNYRFIIKPEIPLVDTGDLEKDLIENTQNQTNAMEDFIRSYPTQWVWMHPRWRTTPEKYEAYKKAKEEKGE